MAPALGDVINTFDVSDKVEIQIAIGQNVPAGPVYKFGASDWRAVPVDGSIVSKKIYILPVGLDNTLGTVVKTHEAYGDGARFMGKADGAIVVNTNCRVSETASHAQQLQAQADPTAPGGTYLQAEAVSLVDAITKTLCQYVGHHDEIQAVAGTPTDAVDEDVDCIFQVKRLL